MEEKRRHQRYSGSKQRNFIAKYENINRILGEVKDFSRSGISFFSEDHLNKEDQIKLDLQINGLNQNIPAGIQILWSKQEPKGYTYGARIIDMSPESKFDILDLLYQDWKKTVTSGPLLN